MSFIFSSPYLHGSTIHTLLLKENMIYDYGQAESKATLVLSHNLNDEKSEVYVS